MIIYGKQGEPNRYFDKNGIEITASCKIRYEDGHIETVYPWSDECGNYGLGTDATNPSWIKSGRAEPCEYGIYPLGHNETNEVEVVNEG